MGIKINREILKMPKHITDLKEFTNYFVSESKSKKKQDEKKHYPQNTFTNRMVIKYNANNVVKFKLRTSKKLLTYKTNDTKTVKKILTTLPPTVNRVEIKPKAQAKRKNKKD